MMELKIVKIFLNIFFSLDESEIILKEYWNLQPKKKILKDWIPLSKLDWYWLSGNLNAIDLLEANQHEIFWEELSCNKNAIHLLKNNLEKINWNGLALNKNAIEIIKENPEKINWSLLSKNKNAIH